MSSSKIVNNPPKGGGSKQSQAPQSAGQQHQKNKSGKGGNPQQVNPNVNTPTGSNSKQTATISSTNSTSKQVVINSPSASSVSSSRSTAPNTPLPPRVHNQGSASSVNPTLPAPILNSNSAMGAQESVTQQQGNSSIEFRELIKHFESLSNRMTKIEESITQNANVLSFNNQMSPPPTFTVAKGSIPTPGNMTFTGGNPDPSYNTPYDVNSYGSNQSRNRNGTNDSDSDVSAASSLRRKRRISILDNLVRSGEEAVDNNPRSRNNNNSSVQYTRIIPSFDHIKLNELTLRAVIKFINDIMDYEFRYKIPINMKAQISEHCFRRLSIKFHGRIDYQDKYKDMTRNELGKLLMDYVKPETQSQFRQVLEDIKLRYNSTTITQDEYKYFYESLIEYSLQFLKWYEILSDQTDPKIIPPCNNKDKGLIKIFLSKLPGELGQELYAELYKEYPYLSSDKNLSFHTFHELFIQLVESHNSKHISTRSALNMYENVGRLKTKDNIKLSTQTSANKSYNNDRFKPHQGGKVLHNISNIQLETNSDPSDAESNVVTQEQDNDSNLSNDIDTYNEGDLLQENPALSFPDDDNLESNVCVDELNAIVSSSSQQSQPKVCFSMIFYNRCDRPNCKYIHDGPNMYKAHAHYLSLLGKSKFASTSQRPATQSYDRNNSNVKQKPNHGLHMILPYQFHDETTFRPEDHERYLHFLRKSYVDSHTGLDILDSVIRSGTATFHNGTSLDVDNILFDTGALHGNYISHDWFMANKDLLQHDVIDVNARVKLADNKTVVNIQYVVFIRIVFMDSADNPHMLSDYFSVIETTTNMIIGLPAIILKLGSYFQDIIEQAIRNYSSQFCANLPVQSNVEVEVDTSTTVQPWSGISPLEDAPEDMDTPLPCSFTEALHFMEVGYEQAKQDFIDLIPTHVCKEFIEQTKIMDLLMSKGLDVFIPRNWKGIQGVPPLKLEWRPDVPTFMKPKPWPVNPRLYKTAEQECKRLTKYFYRKSNSPVASNLVIAPKATPPYIRFCGNYVAIGKYLITGHYPIPRVTQALAKIVNFQIYLDFDMANSFHQFIIDEISSALLSVQTPWGQFEPMFLPEGIPPASGELQKYVDIIFEPIKDFAIVIFDNLLVLAHDFEDAYKKTEIVFDLCLKHNLFLKFSKTWLGYSEVKFFGYVCKPKSYSLSQDRKDALQGIPFPSSKKAMQSFLGAALFFKSFIPNYSTITAPLNDMLKKDFAWDPSNWKMDYHAVFASVKEALQQASSIFYPNYELKWILRTDASDFGVGAVLLQVDDSVSPPQYQPIQFVSQKLSPQATRWSTIEKEAYAVYFGVKSFSYYLIGKPFVLQTDHANLQWMEASVVPKILRWRIYLQSFQFVIQHIAGKANSVADWLSRLSVIYFDHEMENSCSIDHDYYAEEVANIPECYIHMLSYLSSSAETTSQSVSTPNTLIPSPYKDPSEVLKQVHNARMGHHGVRKTYLLLNQHFPGHRIPHKVVADFVSTCPICQKERLGMVDNIRPITKHLKPDHLHAAIGADVLTVTPADELGNSCLIVIVNHFTKLVYLYPAVSHTAIAMATALFVYVSNYGLVDVLYSDPGSDLMSEAVQQLNTWLGIRHKVSIVDRHQSNGVEGSNKQILRHLRALVYDERVLRTWSAPTTLPIIQYILNSTLNSETNMVPFELHFGQNSSTYHRIPSNLNLNSQVNDFIQLLNSNLKHLLEVSRAYQLNLVKERTGSDSNNIQFINQYQPGDYVLKQIDMSKPRPSKLHPQFLGPYQVISHIGNDIQCKNLITGEIKTFHVDMVKIFHGNSDQAYHMAMIDTEQYEVDYIKSYRGDPTVRSTTEFLVRYKDGDELWLPYSKDLSSTQQFETFCRVNSQLFYLLYNANDAKRIATDIKSKDITTVQPGTTVYVDLRSYGEHWYKGLDLPDKFSKSYVVEYQYTKWHSPRNRKRIHAYCKVFDESWTLDNLFVHCFGHTTTFDADTMILVTSDMVRTRPFLKTNTQSA